MSPSLIEVVLYVICMDLPKIPHKIPRIPNTKQAVLTLQQQNLANFIIFNVESWCLLFKSLVTNAISAT